ncbi:hypothetical protein M2159_009011 [Streptomyces sp. SAI-090]|nr:hypothetical protein [Streptomyces sp. SAI-090]
MLRGLKSIFGLLRARKAIFTNPAARILAEAPGAILPMPLNVNDMRRALNSTDPVQDLRCALSALHGLRSGQLRLLKLTDIDGARLIVGDRVIVFVAPVRERLTAYLNHRTARRPATANPCLFTHPLYANGTDPVGPASSTHAWAPTSTPATCHRPTPARSPRRRRCQTHQRDVRPDHRHRSALHGHPGPPRLERSGPSHAQITVIPGGCTPLKTTLSAARRSQQRLCRMRRGHRKAWRGGCPGLFPEAGDARSPPPWCGDGLRQTDGCDVRPAAGRALGWLAAGRWADSP